MTWTLSNMKEAGCPHDDWQADGNQSRMSYNATGDRERVNQNHSDRVHGHPAAVNLLGAVTGCMDTLRPAAVNLLGTATGCMDTLNKSTSLGTVAHADTLLHGNDNFNPAFHA